MKSAREELYLYLEDAPVASSRSATGLSKALIPLLREIAARTSSTFIVQAHQYVDGVDVLRIGPRTTIASKFHHYLARISSRLPFMLGNLVARIHGTCLGRAQRSSPGTEQSVVCWSPIGMDPLSVIRASAFASALGLRFEAYLVDDIETHPANLGKAGLHSALRRALRSASAIYAITPELATRCAVLYGTHVKTLPLTADIPSASACARPPKFFAAYLGSINHLYEDGLKLLFQIVAELRVSTGKELTVRMISRPADVAGMFDCEVPAWIISGTEDSPSGLAAALEDSQLCYLPYSHRETDGAMVSSSFPSKLLDYLSWARHIMVFAPDGSVPFNLFRREGLKVVTDSAVELRSCLSGMVDATHSESRHYREVLNRHHGPGQASAIIFAKE